MPTLASTTKFRSIDRLVGVIVAATMVQTCDGIAKILGMIVNNNNNKNCILCCYYSCITRIYTIKNMFHYDQ